MNFVERRVSFLWLTPFALAVYPILYAWGAYPTLSDPVSVFRAVVAVALGTVLFLIGARALCGNWLTASLAVSASYMALLAYLAAGHEFAALMTPTLGVGYVCLSAAAIVAVARGSLREHHRNFCRVLAVVSLILLLQVVPRLVPGPAPAWRATAEQIAASPAPRTSGITGRPQPDIYYVVLDGYGRDDIFRRAYGFDNEAFLEALRIRGFYVAESARSNYVQTDLSLASSLNMSYLDALARGREEEADREPARYLIRHGAVARLLQEAGYRFVFIASDYASTMRLPTVDRCECRVPFPGSFELLLARGQRGAFAWVEPRAYAAHARHVLDEIESLAREGRRSADGPRFVFAHIVSPHPPFVFDQEGRIHAADRPYSFADASEFPGTGYEYRVGYRDQMLFLNSRLLPAIDDILEHATTPPVIVLQGDHGPGLGLDWGRYTARAAINRAGILAAFHVDGLMRGRLYPGITPVNYFRVVLGRTLGADLPLLRDASYYSPWSRPFSFTRIPPEAGSEAGS